MLLGEIEVDVSMEALAMDASVLHWQKHDTGVPQRDDECSAMASWSEDLTTTSRCRPEGEYLPELKFDFHEWAGRILICPEWD